MITATGWATRRMSWRSSSEAVVDEYERLYEQYSELATWRHEDSTHPAVMKFLAGVQIAINTKLSTVYFCLQLLFTDI